MSTIITFCDTQKKMVSVSQACTTCNNCTSLRQKHKRRYIPNSIRKAVLMRDNFTCKLCGKKSPEVVLSIDHIISASNGGLPTMENLQVLCIRCNHDKNINIDAPKYFNHM